MRQFTIQRVMLITLFALVFAIGTRVPVDTDTWWHIRSGEHTLTEGMIYQDPFSHTKGGEDWINHSWGSQIVLYFAYEVAGDVGLALYTAVLATVGVALLYPVCAGNVYLRAFALALGAMTAAVFWTARPQMFSFVFSALSIYLLFSYKYRKIDRLWWFVPLMLVWGNLHAGFSIGFILLFGVVAGEIVANVFNRGGEYTISLTGIRKLLLIALVSVAVLVVNPYTFDMLLVPFQTVSIGALRRFIQEWNSPNFQESQTWPFLMLLFGVLGAVGASKRRLQWTEFFLLIGTAFLALTAGRNIALFAVVATPIFTFHIESILEERGWSFKPTTRVTRTQARINAVLAAVIVLGVLAYIVSVLEPESVNEAQREFLPVQAAEFIESEQPAGPMFNSYNWGGYLMFALPDYPVYVDGRTDLYKNDFLLRYLDTAVAGDDWRDVLDEDGINLVVVESGSGLGRVLADEPGWTQIYPTADYPDDDRVIYQRDEPL
jgi:hypothetical protein